MVNLVPLLTVGHGVTGAEEFAALLRGAGVVSIVDIRSAPGSRRSPAFRRVELALWPPEHAVSYRWEPRLGGFRRSKPDTANVALRHPAFRGYADHMRTPQFLEALDAVVAEAAALCAPDRPSPGPPASSCVMCAESVWWRCHRRMVADAAVLTRAVEVGHLMHDGRVVPHRLTDSVRVDEGLLVYDGGVRTLPGT
jgi:uncharacterized protein (DUF488 family)